MKKNYFLVFILSFISFLIWAKRPNTSSFNYKNLKKTISPWSIGIGGIYTFNAYKGTRDTRLIIPMLSYQGERLTIAGPYLGYKIINKKEFSVTAQAFLYPLKFEPNKSTNTAIQKLNKRTYTIMAGIKGNIPLKKIGKIQAGVSKSIYGADGYFLNGQYNYPIYLPIKKNIIFVTPGIGIEWHSRSLNNYYYGVTTTESQHAGLPIYNASSSFNPFISINILYNFNKVWAFGAATRVTFLPKTIQNSPMVDKKSINTTILFLSRIF